MNKTVYRALVWPTAVHKMATPSRRRNLKTCDRLIASQLTVVMYWIHTYTHDLHGNALITPCLS
jgi:hypothetical protein